MEEEAVGQSLGSPRTLASKIEVGERVSRRNCESIVGRLKGFCVGEERAGTEIEARLLTKVGVAGASVEVSLPES